MANQHTGGEGLLFISSASCGGVKFKMDWTSGLQERLEIVDQMQSFNKDNLVNKQGEMYEYENSIFLKESIHIHLFQKINFIIS